MFIFKIKSYKNCQEPLFDMILNNISFVKQYINGIIHQYGHWTFLHKKKYCYVLNQKFIISSYNIDIDFPMQITHYLYMPMDFLWTFLTLLQSFLMFSGIQYYLLLC